MPHCAKFIAQVLYLISYRLICHASLGHLATFYPSNIEEYAAQMHGELVTTSWKTCAMRV